jgi:NitT/TauT family transport system substrate-binding protein
MTFLRWCSGILAIATIALVPAPGVAQAQAPLISLTVGGVFSDDMTPIFYAEKAGYFRREGLDVNLVPATSGSAMAAAVIAGTYQFGKASLLSVVNAHLKQIPLDVVAAGATYDSKVPFAAMCVANDSPIVTGTDLNGKTVGTPALNDLNELVIDAWVDQRGGDYTTLHNVELPLAVAADALAQRRVDASVLMQPKLADALAEKQVKSLGNAYDAIAPHFVFAAYFASSDYAEKHPDIVAKFVRALYAAAAYTNAHHDATAAMMADVTKVPLPVIERMPRVDGATATVAADFQPIIDKAAKYHMIPHGFPAHDMLVHAPDVK